jgi:hypothetical protein
MSGCFGGGAIDSWLESNLNAHLDECEADEAAEELAEELAGETFGNYLGSHSEHGSVFEEGYGEPKFNNGELCGMRECKTVKTKTGKVLVKGGSSVYNPKKKRYEFKPDGVFFVIEEE